MNITKLSRRSVLQMFHSSLAFLALLAFLAHPTEAKHETYTIQLNFEEGQTIQTNAEERVDLEMQMEMEINKNGEIIRRSQNILQEFESIQTFKENTLETADGKPTRISRTYHSYDCESKSTPPALRRPVMDELLLKGKTICFTRSHDRISVTQEGTPEPQLTSVLKGLESLDTMYSPVLPSKPVRLHETWEPAPVYLKRLLKHLKKIVAETAQEGGTLKLIEASGGAICKLVKIQKDPGGSIGVIEMTTTMKATYHGQSKISRNDEQQEAAPPITMASKIDVTINGKTLLSINLGSSQLVSDTTTGTIEFTLTADVKESGEPTQMTITAKAEGPIESNVTFEYVKK